MKVVLDTNVLVAALWSPYGAPAQVLDLVLVGSVTLMVDDRLLAEYHTVLHRPRFGFSPEAIKDVLEFIKQESMHVTAAPLPPTLKLPDPTDRPFVEVAISGAEVLVTGNIKHFPPQAAPAVRIMTPAMFLTWFANRTS